MIGLILGVTAFSTLVAGREYLDTGNRAALAVSFMSVVTFGAALAYLVNT